MSPTLAGFRVALQPSDASEHPKRLPVTIFTQEGIINLWRRGGQYQLLPPILFGETFFGGGPRRRRSPLDFDFTDCNDKR